MSDIFFDDFVEQIKEFQRQQLEEREKILADVITKYDFVVGSKDLKGMLETSLPEGANTVYRPFIEDLTSVYAIKKFDMMDYFSVKPGMKKCQWIYGEDDCGQDGYFCSECGHFVKWNYSDDVNFIKAYYYCPNCGADMREEGGRR